jgi:hypothetical protein
MFFVTDAYINFALQGNKNYPNVKYEEYDSIEKIKKYMEAVEAHASANLGKMMQGQLEKKRNNSPGLFTGRNVSLAACFWRFCGGWMSNLGTWIFLQYRAALKRK